MDKEKADKEVRKLLMSLLVTRGVSAVTIGKIMGTTQQNISLQIPVSSIQKDVRRYEQNIQREAANKAGVKAR
jgi:hypothetical protein